METVSTQIEIMEVLYEAARKDGDRDARERAHWALERLDAAHKTEILVMYAASEIERIWRADTRGAEKGATGATPNPQPTPTPGAAGSAGTAGTGGGTGPDSSDTGTDGGGDTGDGNAEPQPVSEYDVWLRDPSLLDWGRGGRALGKQALKDFRAWLGDRRADYFERGRVMGLSHCFLGDFSAEGADEYHTALTMVHVDQLIDNIAARIHVEPTPELLAEEVPLGDGTRVTWGKATVAQLEQRIEMFKIRYVGGSANTAARLRNVVNQLKARGATCFEELA